MNLLLRAKLLTLSGAFALGGLAVAAPAALAAPPPQIYPLGGPAQVTTEDNGGFTPGHTVRLEVWTTDWNRMVAVPTYVTVNPCGNLSLSPNGCGGFPGAYPWLNVNNYVGDVVVTAYDTTSGTSAWPVTSHVYPSSAISAYAVGYRGGPSSPPACTVYVTGSNFQATTGQYVLVKLTDGNGNQLDSKLVSPVGGNINAMLFAQSWNTGATYQVTANGLLVGQRAQTSVTLCPPF